MNYETEAGADFCNAEAQAKCEGPEIAVAHVAVT